MRCATHAHPAAADMGCAAHPHSTSTSATEVGAATAAKMCAAAASDSSRGRIRGAGENGRYGNDGEELGF
jgi:hypothetical protein